MCNILTTLQRGQIHDETLQYEIKAVYVVMDNGFP